MAQLFQKNPNDQRMEPIKFTIITHYNNYQF